MVMVSPFFKFRQSKKYQSGIRFEAASKTFPLVSFPDLVTHNNLPTLSKDSELSNIIPRRKEDGAFSPITKETRPFLEVSPPVWIIPVIWISDLRSGKK